MSFAPTFEPRATTVAVQAFATVGRSLDSGTRLVETPKWGAAEYGRSASKGWASKSGFRLAVKGKWQEFGQTGWTSYKWNHPVYGGYTSVYCYVCTGIKIQY